MTIVQDTLTQLGLTSPGIPAPMVQELKIWVPLPFSAEGSTSGLPYQVVGSSRSVDDLRGITTQVVGTQTRDFVSGLIDKGLLRPDPADPTLFQVLLGLRVVYPASQRNQNVVAGKGPLALVLLNHGQYLSWTKAGTWIPVGGGSTAVKPSDITIAPSYEGYAYLQEALAALNIISVSVDHNFAVWHDSAIETRADTVIAALDVMHDQAADAGSRYFGRLAFSDIGLMGHSRGGDGVVRAVKKIVADPTLSTKYTIKTVCSLAPTDYSGSNPPSDRIFLDINDLKFYHVLYGALDGDVSGGDGANGFGGTGFRHYDRARCPKSMVFLDSCAHDYFNTVWGATPAEKNLADPRITSAGNHRAIATDYICDLFRWQLGSVPAPERFDGRSGNRAGAHASIQWVFGTLLKQIDDFENPAVNLLGGTRTIVNLGQPVTIADMASITISGDSLAPHTGHQTHVLQTDLTLGTTGTPRILTDAIPATDKDWSTYNTLIVSLSGWFDPTSEATIAAANLPRLKVTITDAANVSASVDWTQYGINLPSRPVFKTLADYGNVTLMRLETIPLPLTTFSGPDLTQITTLALDIMQGNDTHVFVDNIHLVQR